MYANHILALVLHLLVPDPAPGGGGRGVACKRMGIYSFCSAYVISFNPHNTMKWVLVPFCRGDSQKGSRWVGSLLQVSQLLSGRARIRIQRSLQSTYSFCFTIPQM